MMLQMLAVFADFEHATIVDRVSAGIERRAKEGRWYAGRPPFGYLFSDEQRTLVPDPVKTPVVRRIFDLYTRKRLGTIAIARQQKTKALLRLLIQELRVDGRAQIQPTYRLVTPEVCRNVRKSGQNRTLRKPRR